MYYANWLYKKNNQLSRGLSLFWILETIWKNSSVIRRVEKVFTILLHWIWAIRSERPMMFYNAKASKAAVKYSTVYKPLKSSTMRAVKVSDSGREKAKKLF